MEDMEKAIEGVLNNPQIMEKIMGMAQAFSMPGPSQDGEQPAENPTPGPDFDPSKIAELTGLLTKANIDSDQQNLLKALTPYMSSGRIQKLRRAMQAAHLAEMANSMLGSNFSFGR